MDQLQIGNCVLWLVVIPILVGLVGHLFVYRILLALTQRTKIATDNLFSSIDKLLFNLGFPNVISLLSYKKQFSDL